MLHCCGCVFSAHQDDFMVISVQNDFDTVIETMFKTEFVTTVSKAYAEKTGNRTLPIIISDT